MFEEFIKLISTPWLGSVLGVVGLCAAIFFYLRSRKTRRVAYQHDSTTVVGGADATFPVELEILFEGEKIPRVTSGEIVIWNSGNTTIGESEVVGSDPLRFQVPEGESILKVTCKKVCREVNGCKVTRHPKSKSSAQIHFDFLDPGDGAAFEVLHTGDRDSLEILGTLRGLPKGLTDYGRVRWSSDRRFKSLPLPLSLVGHRLIPYMLLIVGIGVTLAGIFDHSIKGWVPKNDELLEMRRWGLISVGVLYTALSATLLWLRRRRYPSALELGPKKRKPSKRQQAEQDGAGNA